MKTRKQEVLIYELKVTLKGFKPPIWRRIRVSCNIKLDELHYILQSVMGWTNSHLHMFTSGKVRYSEPHPDDEIELEDEKLFRLNQIAFKKGDKFIYEYDFGDSWI